MKALFLSVISKHLEVQCTMYVQCLQCHTIKTVSKSQKLLLLAAARCHPFESNLLESKQLCNGLLTKTTSPVFSLLLRTIYQLPLYLNSNLESLSPEAKKLETMAMTTQNNYSVVLLNTQSILFPLYLIRLLRPLILIVERKKNRLSLSLL